MIMQFDHLAFSCNRNNLSVILREKFYSYRQVFHENGLPNISAKKILLGDSDATDHDIIFLQCDKTAGIPVEITAYDRAKGRAKYDTDGSTIIVRASNIEESNNFYRAIGFKPKAKGVFYLNTLMDALPIELRTIKTDEDSKYKLDNLGFCCIGLITNNAEKEKKRLESKSITTTAINSLTVNKKELNIFFAYNEFGDMVEFINPNRKAKL